jgi:quinol-cytochrome oxidoreductase complex cytochrome b subunit
MPLGKRLYGWVAERYPVEPVRDFLRGQAGKLLPPHTSWWHTLGSLLLYLTVNQIVTGVLLMVYYRPAPETAYESIHHIMTRMHFGWLIRGLHAWGANVMIVALVAHMFRTFAMGTYKKPRELTWVAGVLILGTVLSFGFTGYLLPWNQVSYWATTVGTEITGAIPLVGEAIKTLLRGGDAVGGETLSRFYVVHVAILPWILVFLVALHILLVRVHGLSPLDPVGKEPKLDPASGLRFYPDHVAKEAVVFSIFFTLLVAIVFLLPPELGEKADAFRSPEGVKPEWYFLPTYQLLKYLPKLLGILVSVVPFAVVFLWPFIDRSPYRRPRERPWSMAMGLVALSLALVFGVLGLLSERTVNLFGTPVHFDIYGVPRALPAPAKNAGKGMMPPTQAPEIKLSVATEEGKKMLVATVTREGKPIKQVTVAFSTRADSESSPVGEDDTIADGSAAVRFPEGVPGGPKGELRIRAEIREPPEMAGIWSEGTFPGGIPVPTCPWAPRSAGAISLISVTLLAGIASAVLFRRLVRGAR